MATTACGKGGVNALLHISVFLHYSLYIKMHVA